MQTKESDISAFRAWRYLIWLSLVRQMRANLMIWISLGLLACSFLVILATTHSPRILGTGADAKKTMPWSERHITLAQAAGSNRWTMRHYRFPRRTGETYEVLLGNVELAQRGLPWDPCSNAVAAAATASMRATLEESTGFFVFSNTIVFNLFTTFLLPLWSLSFATEGLGREREAGNLIWVLTRPLSRPAIFLAKYLAILPWSLALNLGGFALLCLAGGTPGRLALAAYWPAIIWGTLAFTALFHLMGAALRRAAVVAILYSFFFETFFGNLYGHIKRLSISFYVRCLMFDRVDELGIRPANPDSYLPVSGTFALCMLLGASVACVLIGMWLFSRQEFLEET